MKEGEGEGWYELSKVNVVLECKWVRRREPYSSVRAHYEYAQDCHRLTVKQGMWNDIFIDKDSH